MGDLIDWARQNLWAAWGVLAAGLAAAELLTLDLTLLMLASGALMGGVAALVFPGIFWLQLVVALITAVATLFLLRPTLLERVRRSPGYRSSTDNLVGSTGLALTSITSSAGEVKIDGQPWEARPYQAGAVIEAGEQVEVFGLDGITLLVHPVHRSLGS